MGLIVAMAVFSGFAIAHAQTVAFTNDPVATTYGGASDNGPGLNIGVTFNVSGAGIEVFQLGAFDWQGDGLNAAHVVTLFHNEAAIASVTVPAGTSVPLVSGYRFMPLASPVYLSAGTYAVISYQMNGANAGNDPYGENNASGFNGGGNVSPADGIYQFTTTGSPLYPNNVAGGYDFASASFTYTNVVGGSPSTWSGGGANNNWSTTGNWDVAPVSPASLTFVGNTRLVNTNDLSGFVAEGITFDAAAGAFTLNGNAATLSGTISFNGNPASLITQTVNLPLAISKDVTFDTPTNGNLTLGGNLTSDNYLTKIDGGTLTLGGSNTFGFYSLSGGTNVITGNTAFTGPFVVNANRFYVADGDFISGCKGTLIIQPGATFSVTGNYGDAGVIGRDSGSGIVIQNGGTFNFNMANQSYLFVGASGSTATRSEYDMNGGVFDMHGETLGLALGANAVITGLVNQVSGVITNVGNLLFSPFFTQGHGIYNLTGGTIYIGSGGMTVFSGGGYEVNLGGGTIAAGASWSSPLNMNLTGINGPVTFNPEGNTIVLSGGLSGTGGLTVSGGGILELSGVNTYTGDTTVSAGSILQLDSTGSSAGAIRVANGGLLNLNFSGTFAVGSFYTNGVALPVGTYTAGSLPNFITGSGQIQVASGISTGLWTGQGGNNNWSTGANWDNNAVPIFPHSVTFAGASQLNNNNDLSGITVASMIFSNNAGAFTLGGNSINLSGNIGFAGNPAALVTQTVNLAMNWTGAETIDTPTNISLALGGNITSASDTSLIKLDSGSLTLGGVNSIQSWGLNGGTTILTGNTTINGASSSSFVYMGNGDVYPNSSATLIIQPGATLTMSGTFGDAFVIGRDSGSGTIIQNGGTFTYASNQSLFLIGATSNPGTQAQYNMNGGTLDLNGNTLGVALGDNGVTYTANLIQTNGSIINVFKLDLGVVRSFGHGVYTLNGGSITIDFGGITSDDNSYGLNLGGGTILASSTWASSLNMTLTGTNGSVTFIPQGNTITLSGILSGPGGLIASGGGTLELSGANSYIGDTIVTNGSTLQLDSIGSSACAFRIVSGSTFNLNYSGNYVVGALYVNGVAQPNGTYNSGNLSSVISGSGSIQVVGAISSGLWTGQGANNNWSTGGNWDNDVVPIFPHTVTFAGNSQLNNNNDLTAITIPGLTFSNNAGAFVIGGNSITLNNGITFSSDPASPVTQTINLPLVTTADIVIGTRTNGNITLNGGITGGNQLTQGGPDNSGALTLGGANALKGLVVNNGTNIITGNTLINGIGGSSFFYVPDAGNTRNATLIIQNGATLTVTNGFQDAAVIARDGAHGKVIQNGGTFNFAINDGSHNFLFVGASGQPGATAEYDMNGGLLDMHGDTLGIGLGVNAGNITAVINQTGGVISNVLNLSFSPFFSTGGGTYNLTGGSMYIGSSGITVFSGGTAQMNLGGGTIGAVASWSSPLNMTLTGNNGATTFNPNGNTITLSGVLSGSGGLTASGSGTFELSGANTYTGDTTVASGSTLKLDSINNKSGAFRAVTSATFNLNYSGTLKVASFYTNSVALATGTYSAANLSAYLTGSGLVQVTGSVPNTPTNITFSVSGGNMTLSWPPSYLGWILQVQTNSLSKGISSNWVDVANSGNVTTTNIPINSTTPTAFYRLRSP